MSYAKIDIKKILLSTGLAGVGIWIVAGIWHNLIMARFYEKAQQTHDGLGLLLAAYSSFKKK